MRIRSMRNKSWAIVATLSIGMGLGCQGSAPPDPADTEVEAVVSVFEPPADGKLTDEQVRMYVAATKDPSGPATELPADAEEGKLLAALENQSRDQVEAARQLGYDPDEFQWVQARIMEAQLPVEVQLDGLAADMKEAMIEGLEKRRDDTADPEERARLEKQIAVLETPPGGGDAPSLQGVDPAARAHNLELLERHLAQEDAPEAAR